MSETDLKWKRAFQLLKSFVDGANNAYPGGQGKFRLIVEKMDELEKEILESSPKLGDADFVPRLHGR